MGQPIEFAGSNVVMCAPEGAESVQDMHVYRTRHSCVSCWTLTPEEFAEVNQTGRIFISVLAGGRQPPVYVGSESTCRQVMVDLGPVWPMAPRAPAPPVQGIIDGNVSETKRRLLGRILRARATLEEMALILTSEQEEALADAFDAASEIIEAVLSHLPAANTEAIR